MGIKTFEFSWPNLDDAESYELLEREALAYTFTSTDHITAASPLRVEVPLYQKFGVSYKLQTCESPRCPTSIEIEMSNDMSAAIGYFKASKATGGAFFGDSVALSGDGLTLAVGSPKADDKAGAVYIFRYGEEGWVQELELESPANAYELFGEVVALSRDGAILAVGAPGARNEEGEVNAGVVYVFEVGVGGWSREAQIRATWSDGGDEFGHALALSPSGSSLVVGAPNEDSALPGDRADGADNEADKAGAAYVFERDGDAWIQRAFLKASNAEAGHFFGTSVAMGGEGETVVVGAPDEDNIAVGINGEQSSTQTSDRSGAVYIFTRDAGAWSQEAYVKASNNDLNGNFGTSVALSTDARVLAVGGEGDHSNSTGVNGNQADASASYAGAVYVFERSATTWAQVAYVKASNTDPLDYFGTSVALSADGSLMAVGAQGEDSNAIGIGGDEGSGDAAFAGASYVFEQVGGEWRQLAYVKASNTHAGSSYGDAVALSDDGSVLAVGAPGESVDSSGIGGSQIRQGEPDTGAAYLY